MENQGSFSVNNLNVGLFLKQGYLKMWCHRNHMQRALWGLTSTLMCLLVLFSEYVLSIEVEGDSIFIATWALAFFSTKGHWKSPEALLENIYSYRHRWPFLAMNWFPTLEFDSGGPCVGWTFLRALYLRRLKTPWLCFLSLQTHAFTGKGFCKRKGRWLFLSVYRFNSTSLRLLTEVRMAELCSDWTRAVVVWLCIC